MNIVAKFEVSYSQYLDSQGRAVTALPSFATPENLAAMYRVMVLTRVFDAKAIALQRTGIIGTYASSLGQEAISVGVVSAMRKEDVFLPYYRDYGGMFLRGVSMTEILLYWGGDERGSNFAGPREDFPISVPIASQAPHAAGVAAAFRTRNEPRVAVCTAGDGATSKGDFYEALNVAGLWCLPAVFIIENNQWAISVPRCNQTLATTLAQKAIAAGVNGEQVDGNDAVAVREAAGRAIEKARSGGGPTLIEAVTYRLSDHTTADDATRYRGAGEVSTAWGQEPIGRLRNYLASINAWDKDREEKLLADCAAQVQAAVDAFNATEPPRPEAMFEHLYATLPDALAPQLASLKAAARGRHG